jgi:plastocyanin
MRIIPRQLKMVEASARGESVNLEWGKNAKNRSTHNTYFTLPVIFIMLSNHFPMTYGHDYNWLILLLISAAGASIRAYFVDRLIKPARAKVFAIAGVLILLAVIFSTISKDPVTEVKKMEPANVEVSAVVSSVSTTKLVEVIGNISFAGSAPQGKRILLPSACAAQFKGPVYSDEVIVNNGQLQNVLVRIIKGLEGKTFTDIPNTPVVLDQKGCIYHPRVVAARVGQEVVIINSDSIFHNVRSISKNNPTFNIPMAKKDQRISKRFDHAEIFMQAKCSVHPWMGANIAVVDHPYFSISDEKGEFKIQDLPEGKYTIEAWHEVYGTQTQEIEITTQKNDEIKFVFKKQ